MPHQGPILVVSVEQRPSFAATLDDANLFPVVETDWRGAADAIEQIGPAAIIASASDADGASLAGIAASVARRQPYLPLIAVDPAVRLPGHAIPYFQQASNPQRLIARLKAALRIRSLHTTVMRRLAPGSRSPSPASNHRATPPCC